MSQVTVGFPTTLTYYLHYPMWKVFFSELGCKVETSPMTNKKILDEGVKETVTDACVPIKLYHGHAVALKDKVDYLFIPRMVNVDSDKYITFCPKFLGLPDMIKASIPNLPKIISPSLDRKSGHYYLYKACREIGRQLEKPASLIFRAYRRAVSIQKKFEKIMVQDKINPVEGIDYLFNSKSCSKRSDADLNIAVLGYPYQIYDPYISANLMSWLENHKVRTWTMEMVDYSRLQKYSGKLKKKLFWHFSNKVVWSCYYYLDQPHIDGIIHVTAFGCGPDAMVDKLVELECKKRNFPFLSLMIDEQTGEGGVTTRLEAFTDMIRYRREQQG
ncbi:MAG: acyl-CoA dehydratase activase-related protein [Bacillota bacterium]